MATKLSLVEKALFKQGSITPKELELIFDHLIGQTERGATDDQIKESFDNALANWKDW